jgi:hypothetical protein
MSDELKLFAKMLLVITVVFSVFLYLLAIAIEPALFYFTSDGLSASTLYLSELPIWFLNITTYIPVGLDMGVIFFGLWGIFALSFVAAWKLRENFHKTIKESITKPARKLFSSCLFAMPIINCMTLIAVVAINSLQEAGGIPTGTSPIQGEPFIDFFDLSYSAVIEEIGFRLAPIGAFLIIYLSLTKKKDVKFSLKQKIRLFFMSFLFPDKSKRMAGKKTVSEYGVRGGISLGEWGIVVFTSLVFGFAHFNPGVSWEVGKISSAAFSGLVIALSYLVYGAQASIIMHWFFNAYTDTYLLLSEIYPAAETLANATVIVSFILGLLGWTMVAALGYLKLVGALQKRGKNKQNQDMFSLPILPQQGH